MARFLIPLLLIFSLSACEYKAESLPDYLVADYEVAFPIADTTLSIADFFQTSSIPPSQIDLPSGSTVYVTLDFPFYLADFSENDYEIYWIEPKAIIDNQFPSTVDVSLSCYISALNMQQYSLASNQPLAIGENTLFTGTRIKADEFPIAQANKLYIIIGLKTKEDTSVQKLMENKLEIGFGLIVGLRINRAL